MSVQTLNAPSQAQPGHALVTCPTDTKYDATGRRIELWSPWHGGQRPRTAANEATFISRLRGLAADAHRVPDAARQYDRHDITAIVTALRSTLTADEMLQQAPGLRPEVLVAAYDDLEARRARSEQAWRMIVNTPSNQSLEFFGSTAAQLLPVVISHLIALRLRRKTDMTALAETIHRINQEIKRTVTSTELLEETLDSSPLTEFRAQQIGELLYNTFGEGAWSLSTFLPPRVGTLVPARVVSLLDEGRSERVRTAG